MASPVSIPVMFRGRKVARLVVKTVKKLSEKMVAAVKKATIGFFTDSQLFYNMEVLGDMIFIEFPQVGKKLARVNNLLVCYSGVYDYFEVSERVTDSNGKKSTKVLLKNRSISAACKAVLSIARK
jgi:hypothetical protein